MVLFQIIINRELTPQEGQVALTRMFENIDQRTMAGGFQAIRVAGANRFDNPFPEWLRQVATNTWRMHYNDINYSYQRAFDSRADAERVMEWFESFARPFIRQHNPELASRVLSRVMDETEETNGLESF